MSSLSRLPELVGFFSYSRRDDENSEGALSRLRTKIYGELRLQLGRDFRLWQDTAAIPDGALWEDEISRAISEAVFFIPIITPSSVDSTHCRHEFESFLARERELGRSNLIFPLLYVRVPALDKEEHWRNDEVLKIIGTRQYTSWNELRHRELREPEVARKIELYCTNIVETLRQPWMSPQERQEAEEAERQRQAAAAEAARRAEEDRRIKADAAARSAEENARRRKEEDEARAIADEERRRRDTEEAARRAEEDARKRQEENEARAIVDEERRRRDTEEAARRAEEDARKRQEENEARAAADAERRLREAEAAARRDEERAFAAAKRPDTVAAIDAFLASYPDGHSAADARRIKTSLAERDAAFSAAIVSSDPAVLRAFLAKYPSGAPSAAIRARLRQIEPHTPLPTFKIAMAAGAAVLVLALGIYSLVPGRPNPSPPAPQQAMSHTPPPVPARAPTPPPPPAVSNDDDGADCDDSLCDTTWIETDTAPQQGQTRSSMHFMPNHVINWKNADTGETLDYSSHYSLSGNYLSFDIDNYSTWTATIRGERMTGTVKNTDGETWSWSAQKKY